MHGVTSLAASVSGAEVHKDREARRAFRRRIDLRCFIGARCSISLIGKTCRRER
jgi:hypothetical protein